MQRILRHGALSLRLLALPIIRRPNRIEEAAASSLYLGGSLVSHSLRFGSSSCGLSFSFLSRGAGEMVT